MGSVLDTLLQVPPSLVLALVFLLPALEASTFLGLFVPGETAVLVGGVFAHSGRASLTLVIAAAILGAVLGDQVGYLWGRRYGDALIRRVPARQRPAIDRSVALIRRRGAIAILIGRWVASLRALLPGIAGVSRMPRLRFTVANIVGGTLWAGAVAYGGYLAGASVAVLEQRLGLGSEILAGLTVLVVLVAVLLHRRRSRTGRVPVETHRTPSRDSSRPV